MQIIWSLEVFTKMILDFLTNQGKCNTLCMLLYSSCLDTEKRAVSDKVLFEGDTLYQSVTNNLRLDGKIIHHLLS